MPIYMFLWVCADLYLSISIHTYIHPHLSTYLSIHLSMILCWSVSVYICISLYLSISIYIHLFIYLSIHLSTILCKYRSVFVYIYPYIYIHRSIYLSIYPSIYLSIHTSIHPSIYIHPSMYQYIYPSIHQSIHWPLPLVGSLPTKKKLQVMFRKRANNYRTLLRKMTYKDSLPTTKTLLSNKCCRRAQEGDKRKFEECFGPNCFVISKKINCVGTHGGHQQNQNRTNHFRHLFGSFKWLVCLCVRK